MTKAKESFFGLTLAVAADFIWYFSWISLIRTIELGLRGFHAVETNVITVKPPKSKTIHLQP